MYGVSPRKFAWVLLQDVPKWLGVVVPARAAYSHCASVGSRNSQSAGSSPDAWAMAVSRWQKSSASAKFTRYIGKSSPSPTLNASGAAPTTRFHSPWVTSNWPIQKPLLIITSTWSSPGRRSGSPGGLPITNVPAGAHLRRTPAITRSVPASAPSKGDGAASLAPGGSGLIE